MKFNLEPDSVLTKIPGSSGLPPNVTKGEAVRREGRKMNVSSGPKGSGGGSSSAGPNGTTKGPAGERIHGFHGSPPSTKASHPPGAREKSNPMKVS